MSESLIIIPADTLYQILMAILHRVIKVTMSYTVLIMMSKWIGFQFSDDDIIQECNFYLQKKYL